MRTAEERVRGDREPLDGNLTQGDMDAPPLGLPADLWAEAFGSDSSCSSEDASDEGEPDAIDENTDTDTGSGSTAASSDSSAEGLADDSAGAHSCALQALLPDPNNSVAIDSMHMISGIIKVRRGNSWAACGFSKTPAQQCSRACTRQAPIGGVQRRGGRGRARWPWRGPWAHVYH
jgi:hypothetical protein